MQIDHGIPKGLDNVIARGASIGPDNFLVLDKAALEFAQAHAAELVGMQATAEGMVPNPNPAMAITESTRDMLRGLVVRAFKQGLSPAQLAKAIEASVGFSKHRAYDIAIAETARAQCAGALRTALEGGMTHKRWITNPESPTANHDECGENAKAGWIPIVGKRRGGGFGLLAFPSGDIWPPNHSRCACALAFGRNKENAVGEKRFPDLPGGHARELGDFVAGRCVVSDGAAVAANRLYEEYACWARESEQRWTLPKREFNARLRARFNSTKPQNLLIWHGVGLRGEPQPEDVKQASKGYESAYYRVVKPPAG
jgi:hypothetical protein